jgi:hypothetical protein
MQGDNENVISYIDDMMVKAEKCRVRGSLSEELAMTIINNLTRY